MSFTPLSSTEHTDLRMTQGTLFYIQHKPVVPVSIPEAPQAALDLPLAFARTETGLALVAILSLISDNNSQIGPKGYWMGGYMPVVVRCHPFALHYSQDQAQMLVDLESDWLSREQGKPLFTDQGKPSKILEQFMETLKNFAPNPQRDGPVLQALDKNGLLESWTEVSANLLRINSQKLGMLDDQAHLELRRQGALPIIYAHLFSMARIKRIKQLADQKAEITRQLQQAGAGSNMPNAQIDVDNDIIRFD
ncbi:SapC protein [Desulfonatronum zhilinae]|nr:SapC protein [Desulfonatronum zhilinae]